MQRIGRRWPDQRLLDEIEQLKTRTDNLRLVRNPAEPDGHFVSLVPGTLEERRLYQSYDLARRVEDFSQGHF